MKIHISRNGQTYGPYSVSSVEAFLVNGQLFPNDLAWSHGKSEWTPLKDLLDQTKNDFHIHDEQESFPWPNYSGTIYICNHK